MSCWIEVMSLMLAFANPSPRNVPRLTELSDIAEATCEATDDRREYITLTAISSYESGFRIKALGRMGEVGPWQIMGIARSTKLRVQARIALDRLRYSQTVCGNLRWYASGDCYHGSEASAKRLARAELWLNKIGDSQ